MSNTIWRHLFNKEADSLQRSMENEDECENTNAFHGVVCVLFSFLRHVWNADMIHENNPLTNSFVSVPADMVRLVQRKFITLLT